MYSISDISNLVYFPKRRMHSTTMQYISHNCVKKKNIFFHIDLLFYLFYLFLLYWTFSLEVLTMEALTFKMILF